MQTSNGLALDCGVAEVESLVTPGGVDDMLVELEDDYLWAAATMTEIASGCWFSLTKMAAYSQSLQ